MESSYSIFADFDLSGLVAGPIHGGVEIVVCSEVEVDFRAIKGRMGFLVDVYCLCDGQNNCIWPYRFCFEGIVVYKSEPILRPNGRVLVVHRYQFGTQNEQFNSSTQTLLVPPSIVSHTLDWTLLNEIFKCGFRPNTQRYQGPLPPNFPKSTNLAGFLVCWRESLVIVDLKFKP